MKHVSRRNFIKRALSGVVALVASSTFVSIPDPREHVALTVDKDGNATLKGAMITVDEKDNAILK